MVSEGSVDGGSYIVAGLAAAAVAMGRAGEVEALMKGSECAVALIAARRGDRPAP